MKTKQVNSVIVQPFTNYSIVNFSNEKLGKFSFQADICFELKDFIIGVWKIEKKSLREHVFNVFDKRTAQIIAHGSYKNHITIEEEYEKGQNVFSMLVRSKEYQLTIDFEKRKTSTSGSDDRITFNFLTEEDKKKPFFLTKLLSGKYLIQVGNNSPFISDNYLDLDSFHGYVIKKDGKLSVMCLIGKGCFLKSFNLDVPVRLEYSTPEVIEKNGVRASVDFKDRSGRSLSVFDIASKTFL